MIYSTLIFSRMIIQCLTYYLHVPLDIKFLPDFSTLFCMHVGFVVKIQLILESKTIYYEVKLSEKCNRNILLDMYLGK